MAGQRCTRPRPKESKDCAGGLPTVYAGLTATSRPGGSSKGYEARLLGVQSLQIARSSFKPSATNLSLGRMGGQRRQKTDDEQHSWRWRAHDLTARRHGRKPQRPFRNGKLMVLIETMMKVERALQESSGTTSSTTSQGAVP